MSDLTTPVALFVYRRPEHTKQVLEQIEEIEPPRVLVVGDGPEDGEEEERVESVRRIIAEADLECEVSTEYADSNFGLKERFATGLDWVFDNAEEAIILEDDTVPDISFFRFCDELLERFRGDNRVWDIAGRNELGSYCQGDSSYFYSHYGGIWGWATWRSSYEEYDSDMTAWQNPVVRDRVLDSFTDRSQTRYVRDVFDRTYDGEIETWDYQWGFAKYRNNAVSVVPETNLIENIGFGEGATNTLGEEHPLDGTPIGALEFPIRHPNYIGVDRSYDKNYHKIRTSNNRIPEFVRDILDMLS